MLYIIEHMEEGFYEWVTLEYKTIAQDLAAKGSHLLLTSIKEGLTVPDELVAQPNLKWTSRDVSDYFKELGVSSDRICLLDPSATEHLKPSDQQQFDYFLFGGILGDHPPRDRTGELRKLGYVGRNLDKVQMTTDTAVRVTQIVLQDQVPLDQIAYVDFPELRFSKYESTEMPFRYVKDANGDPILPPGMKELIRKDADRTLDDLL